jgi:protein O-mannosyl-transferase
MNKPRIELQSVLAGGVIVLAGLAAYHNSFAGPFAFDDVHSVLGNPTIRRLWPIWDALKPPSNGATVEGRPIVNLSLAVNYAIGGLEVRGYHAFNLAVHLLAGLALFGIVRRTMERLRTQDGGPGLAGAGAGPAPLAFAFAVGLLWTVHPLQTESVTFISDRAESLMGLFYLLTLYCFARGVGPGTGSRAVTANKGVPSTAWLCLSVFFCLLGMATKEVMVTAPVIVLLYDRTFAAGSFPEAWRRRRAYYAGLAATWIPLILLVAGMGGNRGKAAGFGSPAAWWMYALTQLRAVVHYLRLAFWPHPLVFDYGTDLVGSLGDVGLQALFLAVLAAATAVALRRRSALGFLGAWFFLILAPSSSVVPLASQTMAEHRMYLPLAAVIALAAYGLSRIAAAASGLFAAGETAAGSRSDIPGRFPGTTAFLVAVAVLATGLGCLTSRRNEAYRTQLSLWSDTGIKNPGSSRVRYNLGFALDEAGRHAEARDQYFEALRLDPLYPDAHYMLANDLANEGRLGEAIAHYEEALRIDPDMDSAHFNLAIVLSKTGRTSDAIVQLQETLRLDPDNPDVHRDLGYLLRAAGRQEEAAAQFAEADRLAASPRPPSR